MLGQDVPVVRVMQDPFNRNGDTPATDITDMRHVEINSSRKQLYIQRATSIPLNIQNVFAGREDTTTATRIQTWTTPTLTVSPGSVCIKAVKMLTQGPPLKCYSDSSTWWRYIDCDSVRGYLSCYTR